MPHASRFHETNEWHPSVLDDGRIVYTRWDYVDRSAANYHGLWASEPRRHQSADPLRQLHGADQRLLPAPGDPRLAAGRVCGRGASCRRGRLAGDRRSGRDAALDPKTGQDRFDSIERLTPEVCFPEAPGWPKSYFHSPWPLSEDYYLVSFSFEPLPGMGPGVKDDNATGLYYFDRFGNLELLYRDDGISSMYPIPLVPRPAAGHPQHVAVHATRVPCPRVVACLRQAWRRRARRFVGMSRRRAAELHAAARPDRPITRASASSRSCPRPRPTWPTSRASATPMPRVPGCSWARCPVEPDGSAYFRVPARKPLYFQAVDARGPGRADHAERDLSPAGRAAELRGLSRAAGHGPAATAARWPPAAPPSTIAPGPDGTRPLSYPRLVQPVLDRHCVRLPRRGRPRPQSRLVLTGEPAGSFSRSYESLKPFVRWYEWGGESISQVVTLPGHGGADESPLLTVLDDKDHKDQVRLPAEDRAAAGAVARRKCPVLRHVQPAGADGPAPRRGRARRRGCSKEGRG